MMPARWALTAAAASVLPASAIALEGEREFSVAVAAGPASISNPSAGVAAGLDTQLLWHTSDFWAFGGGLRARAWSGPGAGATVEGVARWTLDALQWIPALGAAIGYQADALDARIGPAVRLEASLGWRTHRDRAWVFRVQAESARAGHLEPTRAMVGVGLVWYGGKGSALDL